MSDCEDAVYLLERTLEKSLENIRSQLDAIHITMAQIDYNIWELQQIHHIDNDASVCEKHQMLKDTYNKHQFAKKLILGENSGQ